MVTVFAAGDSLADVEQALRMRSGVQLHCVNVRS